MNSKRSTSAAVGRVLSLVTDVKPSGSGWTARCPAHDDRNPSLSIAQGDDGRTLLHCHGGCTLDAIVLALGIEKRELFDDIEAPIAPKTRREPSRSANFLNLEEAIAAYRTVLGKETSTWAYRDEKGDVLGAVLRFQGPAGRKTFRPVWKIGNRWQHALPESRPIYQLDLLAKSPIDRVFVAEGEKCAEVLTAMGLLSTTSPGGASGGRKADWSALAGREVFVIPDEDEPGHRYAASVRTRLLALEPPARVSILRLPGLRLGSGDDVAEFVDVVHGGDPKAAKAVIERLVSVPAAKPQRRRLTLRELLADSQTLQTPETIPSGWGVFDRTQPFSAIERGTVTVLTAPPGCYKTAMMARLARGFVEQGHRVEWLAAEMQPRTLVRRMLCQSAQISQAALLEQILPVPQAARLAAARGNLDAIGERLGFVPAPIGFAELEQAADAADVVFIDYLQIIRHPEPDISGHQRIEDTMAKIAECAQRSRAAFIVASAQGRGGGDERRGIHNATRGSSSIEFTADALFCAQDPGESVRQSGSDFTIVFACLKQREGERLPIEIRIIGATGLIAEDVRP